MTAYIDAHRAELGVEPICRELAVAPSTYYSAKSRPPSPRALSDAFLKPKVLANWEANYKVYGARKLWRQLHRQGEVVGRDRVARLMADLGIAGAPRSKKRRTTISDPAAVRAPDLVGRNFRATRPNALWVADFTHVATWSGTVYVAFCIDCYSRLIVGWRAATTMRTELVLDTLEMAIWRRDELLDGLVCHSDAGSQYPSIGSVGDAYDNAMAEVGPSACTRPSSSVPGVPWRTINQVEVATLEYIHWFNQRRLHGEIGDVPPAEFEAAHYRQHQHARVA